MLETWILPTAFDVGTAGEIGGSFNIFRGGHWQNFGLGLVDY